jgi:AAA-like domain
VRPPARAVVGHLIWSADGGVWALWSVKPFPHAHTAVADKLGVHGSIRSLLVNLPPESMLLSVCERLDPLDVVRRMADGVDLDRHPAWASVCDASADWLEDVPLRRRLFYVAAALPNARRPWLDVLRDAQADVGRSFGLAPRPVPTTDLELRRRQARELELRLAQHVEMRPVTAGEVCWIYARSLRRELDEPCFDQGWEPPPAAPVGRRGNPGDAERWRPRGVLAHLTDAVVKEGGDADDEDRPRHRRYVRIDGPSGSSYQTVLALADMPHYFRFPGGGGEWLYYADHAGFPVDWCVRTRSIKNADAQTKVRRKHRDLVGQVDEYDGELTGAPPQLAEAIQAIDEERSELGANPAEPELQATILLSLAAPTLAELEDRAGTLTAMFQPHEYGLARPTGGQAALLRSMLPGSAAAAVCRDYTQFMLARDLAAGSPFCGSDVGDPGGLLLGVSLDSGNGTPVLFDPAFGPKANASPSLAAVGRLGSGKSFFLKRLCWDTVARGGQVVTIDRTQSGEYVRFAEALPGRVQVVRIEAGADVRLDPMRSFSGDERTTVTLGFLSLLAGCSAHTEEGAALADAVDAVASRPGGSLSDIIDELERMGSDAHHPDPAARGLARRLSHYRRSATGALAFGEGDPMSLDADFIVFWAPHLALPDRETLTSEHGARMMLPEQVLGQALLYLVAAVGRRVVFRDPRRFAAALYDEAWALLASPHGQNLLIEGVRDGRKHNGAIWLASQHPNDFAISELEDLLGSRFVFRQARRAIPAALRFLGVTDSVDAGVTLEQGLATGVCLYRDVRDRVGLIQVLPPTLPEIDTVFDTSPSGGADAGRPDAAELALDDPDAFDAEDGDVGELVEYTGRLSAPPELAAGGVAGSPVAAEAPRGEGADAPAGAPGAAPADDEVGGAAPAGPDPLAAPAPTAAAVPPPAADPRPAPPAPSAPDPAPPAPPPPPARVEVIEPDPEPAVQVVRSSSAADAAAEARRRARRRRRTPLAQALADGEER